MKKNQQYEINFAANTVIVTRAFLQAASQTDTPEFNQMMRLRALNMPITVREVRRKSEHRWSYEQMENFIDCVENSEKYYADYLAVRKAKKYLTTWNWFKKTFPNYAGLPELNDEHRIIVTPSDYLTDDADVSARDKAKAAA